MKKHAILIVHNSPTRFVRIDCELLGKYYETTVRFERSWWRLNLSEIWKTVRAHDLVYCWFASWHSFFPVLAACIQGKPSVVVVGGYDVANVPEAHYGFQGKSLKKYIARAVMGLATKLLPFSLAAAAEARTSVGAPSDKISVVYLGVAAPASAVEGARARMALTVGNVWRENLLRKGLLPFVQAARFMPDVRFVHAGGWFDDSINDLRSAAGPNVEFLGFVSDETLNELYEQASVYVQASLHEGFGMSVAEAMAAGCITVATRCGSLPEVVGDAGVYIPRATAEDVANGVRLALDQPFDVRLRANARILERFATERREEMLKCIVDDLISSHAAAPGASSTAKHAAT